MRVILLFSLFLSFVSNANTKDIVMDYLRIHAAYRINAADWYKKGDTWITESTEKSEYLKVAITGDKVAVYSKFPTPISDMHLSGCATIYSQLVPDAAYWDENTNANTKAIDTLWTDKIWSEEYEDKETIIDGWKISIIKKPVEISCVIEPVSGKR